MFPVSLQMVRITLWDTKVRSKYLPYSHGLCRRETQTAEKTFYETPVLRRERS